MFKWRSAGAFFFVVVLVILPRPLIHAQERIPSPLRVCADPDNLPFSSEDRERKGLYLEFAEQIAEKLGVQSEVFWWRTNFGKRAIGQTLLKGKCDIQLGIPFDEGFMGRRLALTKPFLKLRYAIVVPNSVDLRGLSDLRGKTVGLRFNTPPQHVIAEQDDITAQTFLNDKDALAALARGEIDAAFLWGPVAGYYNKFQWNSRFKVISTAGPWLEWQVAIGVKASAETGHRQRGFLDSQTQLLLNSLDGAIDKLQEEIVLLEVKYGWPDDEPLVLDWLAVEPVADKHRNLTPDTQQKQSQAAPVDGTAISIVEGRKLFNGYFGCAHCHGPDAVTSEKNRDLRRLWKDHGTNTDQVFRTTIINGRPSKGMPSWNGNINDAQIAAIRSYLYSIQSN